MINKSKFIKEAVFWAGSITIVLAALIIFIFIPIEKRYSNEHTAAKIYYVDNISEAHQEVIDLFNEKYRERIEVVPVNLPFSKFTTNERKEILARSLRSRSDRIDIFAVDLIWGARFAKWSYTLDQFFTKQLLENVHPKAIQSCYFDNKLISFPLHLDLGVLYYRKDIINSLDDGELLEKKIKQSISWNDFLKLGKKLSKHKNPFYIFAGDSYEGMVCSFHERLSETESRLIFDKDSVMLSHPAARRGLKQLVDCIHRFKLTPNKVTLFDEYKSYIYANETDAVFLRGWSGFHKHYGNVLEDTSNIKNLAIAPLPHFEGSQTSGVFGGWNLMVSKYSEKKIEALEFIKFTFSEEAQKILYNIGGYVPINQSVYNDKQYMAQNQQLSDILKMMEWGKHRPFREDYTKLSDIMAYYFYKALKKEITVDEALNLASQKINSKQAFIR